MVRGGGRVDIECKDLAACEKWRRQVVGEISRAVGKIQDGSLGEARIRELNDEINKLLRRVSYEVGIRIEPKIVVANRVSGNLYLRTHGLNFAEM